MKYLASTLLLFTTKSAFAAALAAVSFTGGTFDNFPNDTSGFRFTVGVSDISVSALGFYDQGSEGLSDAHPVGIFDVLTELSLVSATIPSGVGATLEGGFRFVPVTPVTLLAGRTFVINGYRPTAADGILYNVSDLTTAPFLTYDSEVAANGTGGLVFTNTPFGRSNAWFGPNLKADVVPEPASGALLLLGAALCLRRRSGARRPHAGSLARCLPAAFAIAGSFVTAFSAHARPVVEWSTQYGTSAGELGDAITVDSAGKIWVSGVTGGGFGGANAGQTDVFLSRLSSDGSVDFTRQRGGAGADRGFGVAVVGGSSIFVGGETNSNTIDGRTTLGASDNFALRYDTSGAWISTTRFGSSAEDRTFALAGNATSLLMAGNTQGSFGGQINAGSSDAVLTKRDSTGAAVWTRFVGTSDYEIAFGTDFDSAGNGYLTGYTTGSLSGFTNAGDGDLFVARYDANGTRTLLKQIGTSGSDYPHAVKVDATGNMYLTGFTEGNLGGQTNAGAGAFTSDAFVMKLSPAGDVLWTRLLGGPEQDDSTGLGIDSNGHIWIGGFSDSALGGRAATPFYYDSFVSEFDSDGLLLGTTFIPTGNTALQGLAIGPDDGVYVAGYTTNGEPFATGNLNVFVAKISNVPEPSAALLMASGALALLARRRRGCQRDSFHNNPISIQSLPTTLALLGVLAVSARAASVVEWVTKYGTTSADYARGLTVDPAGKIWVTGETSGSLGATNMGGTDVFLSRLSSDGTVDFTRQRGGSGEDVANGVAVVGNDAVFAGGYTRSSTIDGQASLGQSDNLAVRYTTGGAWLGTTRFGTTEGDQVFGVAGNATHLLMAGGTAGSFDGQVNAGNGDAFLSKRDSTGAVVWTRFVGTTGGEGGTATAFDTTGNAYLAGNTSGSLNGSINAGEEDLFVARYDGTGARTLLKQIGGTRQDVPKAVKADASGNIYLTGLTRGDLGGQTHVGVGLFDYDAFVMKLDNTGNVLWTRLLGGSGEDDSRGIGVDAAGHVWIGGLSDNALGGRAATPNHYDAFVAEFDSNGLMLDTTFLAVGDGLIEGLDIGPDGGVYVAGLAFKPGTTDDDVFVAKISNVPEPSAALLMASGACGLLVRRSRSRNVVAGLQNKRVPTRTPTQP